MTGEKSIEEIDRIATVYFFYIIVKKAGPTTSRGEFSPVSSNHRPVLFLHQRTAEAR